MTLELERTSPVSSWKSTDETRWRKAGSAG